MLLAAAVLAWHFGFAPDPGATLAPAPPGAAAADTSSPSAPAPSAARPNRARPPQPPGEEASDAATDAQAAIAPENVRRIRCVAVSAADGTPIEGVEVLFVKVGAVFERGPHRATTGADGACDVDVPADMVWRAVARKQGLHAERREYVPAAKELRIEMKPAIRVEGRVIDADSRAPVAGVAVRAWSIHPEYGVEEVLGNQQTTDAAGRFAIEDVPDGQTSRIYAARAGVRTADVAVTRTGPGPPVEVVLGDGGILDGTVFDAEGRPAADVEVFQIPPHIELERIRRSPDLPGVGTGELYAFLFPPVRTDARGQYEFRGVRLPIGGVPQPRLAAARDAKGDEARSEPATFTRHGERMTRDIRFLGPPRLTLRAVSAAPVPQGWKLRAQRAGGDPDVTKTLAPGEPSIDFGELRPGRYHVSLGTDPNDFDFGVPWSIGRWVDVAGGAVDVAFPIDLAGTVEGVLVDDEGAPVAGVLALFTSTDDATETTVESAARSAADGRFVIRRVLPHAGTLEIGDRVDWRSRLRGDGGRQFSDVLRRDVAPGGPPLRVVLHRRCRVTGRAKPVPPNLELGGSAHQEAGGVSLQPKTDDDGRFDFEAPFAGDGVLLALEQAGHAPVLVEGRRLPSGGTLDLGDITFVAGFSFAATLRDDVGKPLANAEVWATDPWYDSPVACDGEGRIRPEHLPDRPFHVIIDATATSADWRLAIDPRNPPAEIVVGRGVEVRGRVVDAAEAPAGKTVQVRFVPAERERGVSERATVVACASDGTFVARLQPGRWRAAATTSRGPGAVQGAPFEVAADRTAPLELRLYAEEK